MVSKSDKDMLHSRNKQIYDLFNSGKTYRELSKSFNLDYGTIINIVRMEGLKWKE